MRTFTKLLAVPLAAGFLFAAGCGGGSLCEKAMNNMIELTKKEGSDAEKKQMKEMMSNKDAFIKMCDAMIKKDPEMKAQMECGAKAKSMKEANECKNMKAPETKGDKKDEKKDETHK